MGKGQRLAFRHIGGDLAVVDVSAQLVGHQHHDDVAGLGRLFHFHHFEVGMGGGKLSRFLPVAGTFAQTDHDVHAAFGQVLGMSMALRAKADDGDGLAVQHAEVAVGIVVLVDSHGDCLLFYNLFLSSSIRRGSKMVGPHS